MRLGEYLKGMLLCAGLLLIGPVQADISTVPDETYEALKLDRSKATPKETYDALVKRYKDPAHGAGKGTMGDYWEPIALSIYMDPNTFYKPPVSPKEIAERKDCVECHSDETPVWVRAWKRSTHANLDKIRNLKPEDPLFYKKGKLEEVENNLRSMGKLGEKEVLKEVGCIDCHVDINAKKKADHTKDVRMPTADVCGTCHLREFAERESERDTMIWPNGQWPDGRPSHALDYTANIETTVWAAMPQREVAEGCTMCHTNQNKCDNCHTRHEFSAAESRKPEACATCHSGVDHNNYEAYIMSKHGKLAEMNRGNWNWNVRLKDAFSKGGQTAPTCAACHMEYEGEYTHNITRKTRWANYPFVPGIAENITSDWSEARLDSWVVTCTQCHSERFARSYLDLMDKGTLEGLAKYQEANAIVHKMYEDGTLTGQKTNRPNPPAPEKPGFGIFTQLFWSKGNNPASLELKVLEMAENNLAKMHVGLAHVNPGGWTYTEGWGPMNRAYVEIQDEYTKMQEMTALQARVNKLEGKKTSLLDLKGAGEKISLGGLGGGMLLAGAIALIGWRKRKQTQA
ncbi:multiheme c-type cytochrome [Nitrosomonas eutropha]|uniref:Hydroxylamine oxidoreductase n=3 Tax=Nitrosomonas TaxID=914 RepID=Q0AFG9_NITEC|nr:multiheme c-type cytochrome [Nitrosomonas eutropha]ABI59913.1 aerobic hydroxylamine oxidoreductase precursor [Nitrosomonas eutropha C91]